MEGSTWKQEGADWAACPYNSDHKIPLESLQWHIAKVHKHEKMQKARCPYNFNHFVDADGLHAHMKECSSKRFEAFYSTQSAPWWKDIEREDQVSGDMNQLVPYVEKSGKGSEQVHVHTHVHNHFHYTNYDTEQTQPFPKPPEPQPSNASFFDTNNKWTSTNIHNHERTQQSPHNSNQFKQQMNSQIPKYQDHQPTHTSNSPFNFQPQQQNWNSLQPATPQWTMSIDGRVSFNPPKVKSWQEQEEELVRRLNKTSLRYNPSQVHEEEQKPSKTVDQPPEHVRLQREQSLPQQQSHQQQNWSNNPQQAQNQWSSPNQWDQSQNFWWTKENQTKERRSGPNSKKKWEKPKYEVPPRHRAKAPKQAHQYQPQPSQPPQSHQAWQSPQQQQSQQPQSPPSRQLQYHQPHQPYQPHQAGIEQQNRPIPQELKVPSPIESTGPNYAPSPKTVPVRKHSAKVEKLLADLAELKVDTHNARNLHLISSTSTVALTDDEQWVVGMLPTFEKEILSLEEEIRKAILAEEK